MNVKFTRIGQPLNVERNDVLMTPSIHINKDRFDYYDPTISITIKIPHAPREKGTLLFQFFLRADGGEKTHSIPFLLPIKHILLSKAFKKQALSKNFIKGDSNTLMSNDGGNSQGTLSDGKTIVAPDLMGDDIIRELNENIINTDNNNFTKKTLELDYDFKDVPNDSIEFDNKLLTINIPCISMDIINFIIFNEDIIGDVYKNAEFQNGSASMFYRPGMDRVMAESVYWEQVTRYMIGTGSKNLTIDVLYDFR